MLVLSTSILTRTDNLSSVDHVIKTVTHPLKSSKGLAYSTKQQPKFLIASPLRVCPDLGCMSTARRQMEAEKRGGYQMILSTT